MTNQELIDLARGHETRPWWPNSLFIEDRRLCVVPEGEYERPVTIDADTAERLIIGSAAMWLIEQNDTVWCDKHEASVYTCTTTDKRLRRSSALAAVLAACEAALADGGGE